MNRYYNIILLIIMISSITFAAPVTTFISPPTPNDGSSQTSTTVTINGTVTESNLKTFTSFWEGTNFTMYNDSLVLMLNLDSYSTLSDFSTGGNDATAHNGAAYTSSGKYHGAYTFDGVNDHLSGSLPASTITNIFTISDWVKINKQGVQYNHFSLGVAGGVRAVPYINPSNYISCFYGDDVNAVAIVSDVEASAGVWYHSVCTYDSSTVRLYVNGQFKGSDTVSKSLSTNNYIVGSDIALIALYTNGSVDEVRVWDTVLSQAEITELYKSNFRKYGANSWEFTSTHSNLAYATYEYQLFASDTGGVFGNTEERDVTISASVSGGGAGVPEFSGASIIACLISCIAGNFLFFRKQTPTVN